MKSDLAFVKVNTWPFADQEVIVLTVLHKLVCCQSVSDARRVRITASEYQSSVCLFLCVRVFITPGFIQANTDPY